MSASDDQDVSRLDALGSTAILTARTDRPWELPVSALLISVAPGGLGDLGFAVQRARPDVPWGLLSDRPPSIEHPTLLVGTPEQPVVIAVNVRHPEGTATPETAALAALAGLRLAQSHGHSHVAMPLVGVGAVGLPTRIVAATIIDALMRESKAGALGQLRSITVFDRPDGDGVDAFASTWGEAIDPDVAPPVEFSSTAAAVASDALRLFGGRRLEASDVWFAALRHASTSRRNDVAKAVLGRLAMRAGSAPRDYVRSLPMSGWTPTEAPADDALRKSPLLQVASDIAGRTNSAIVRQRHLLAAAALSGDPLVLDATGVFGATLIETLRAAIADVLPHELPAVWDAILAPPIDAPPGSGQPDNESEEESDDLAGGIDGDLVDPGERIPPERDHLGVGTYVTMLASVIAGKETPVPLSIGLFGEWGSGKSYFMGLLRDQIERLRTQADSGYVDEIEQIGFNAWHYADTNLWASLGNEIFEHLAGVHDGADDRRDALRAELSKKLDQRRTLDTATRQAQNESAQLHDELDRAREMRRVSVRHLARAVSRSEELEQAWKRLGVDDDLEQARLLARELHGAVGDIGTVRNSVRGVRGITLAALGAITAILLTTALVVPADVRMWLARGGVATFALGCTYLAVIVGRVRLGARTLASLASAARDESVSDERARLNDSLAREKVLATQLDEVMTRAGEIGRELADLAPGRRLYGFLNERAGSEDYRTQLGLVSTIRRDLQQLIRLMREWEKDPDSPRPVRRIVLYIDDLDRCSPEQVVEVLQAVHLLLALDLFVVVVGVDPRWLLHSLQSSYSETLGSESLSTSDAVWTATPLDYLEKIFNIPFVLPGMTAGSFETLVRGIAKAHRPIAAQVARDAPAATAPLQPATPSTAVVTSTGHTGGVEHTHDPMTVQSGSQVDAIRRGQRARPRALTDHELTLLSSLGPLVETPRETKRLLNLYRTLRSTRDLGTASDFLGADGDGEYQVVCLLLGVLSARPNLVDGLLWSAQGRGGLCRRPATDPWSGVLDGLHPDDGRNDLGVLTEPQLADWTWVCERIQPAHALVRLDDVGGFHRWGPRIARFSFVLSPLARS